MNRPFAGKACAQRSSGRPTWSVGLLKKTRKVVFPSFPTVRHKELFIEGAHLSTHFFVASSWGILSRV